MTTLLLALALGLPQDEGFAVGRRFPDFALPGIEGGVHRLSDYRGRKVLILSFASW